MTPLHRIPPHIADQALALSYSAGRIKTALTGSSTLETIKAASQEADRAIAAARQVKAMVRAMGREAR